MGDDLRRSIWQRVARYLPAALLILVALHQVVRAQLGPLSAWKGGGFGMFSTTDHPAARYLRCYLVGPHGEKRVPIPLDLRSEELTALALPTQHNLEALAAALAALAPPEVTDVRAVRVEYWPRQFDVRRATLSVHKEREAVVELGNRTY